MSKQVEFADVSLPQPRHHLALGSAREVFENRRARGLLLTEVEKSDV
jgi:hypothetical protein